MKDTGLHSLAFITTMNSLRNSQPLPVLGFIILLTCPVLHGCEPLHFTDSHFTAAGKVPVKMSVHSKGDLTGEELDILIFQNDATQYLECWQRVQVTETDEATIASMNGEKIAMACSGMSDRSHEDWMWVSSLASLSDAWSDLEGERRETPVMSGGCVFKAGSTLTGQPALTLHRLSCEIHLRSLKCDFKGRPYEGERLSDVHVYLTNVNASCRIWNDTGNVSRIINQGRLIMEDVSRFSDRSLILQEIEGEVGSDGIRPDIRLRCYPNTAQKEGPGSPFTRLVIQGVLDGEVWYWPIDINRDGEASEEGVRSNCIYTYDIVLTRKGSKDPDTAIKTGTATITTEVKRWEEKEDYTIGY
jgi:hypothetical protein